MLKHRIYYQLKPFIPRSLQIILRRRIVLWKRRRYQCVWPVDERAGNIPENWEGWPGGKKFALVVLHDVDTEKGHKKCLQLMQLDEKMGFRSSFNFVPERYYVSPGLRHKIVERGFEVAVHGLKHDGKLFQSRKKFSEQAGRINHYLREWRSVGFVSPSMHHNLNWVHDLNVIYDASTFDTDPYEPQPDGVGTIFPFWVAADGKAGTGPAISLTPGSIGPELQPATCNPQLVTPNPELETGITRGYVELPYTLPQDFTLFVLMKERNIDIWKKKLDWIAENGGMALFITHPDYLSLDGKKAMIGEYPVEYYEEFLQYIRSKYNSQFWNVLPREMANFWREFSKNKNKANW